MPNLDVRGAQESLHWMGLTTPSCDWYNYANIDPRSTTITNPGRFGGMYIHLPAAEAAGPRNGLVGKKGFQETQDKN